MVMVMGTMSKIHCFRVEKFSEIWDSSVAPALIDGKRQWNLEIRVGKSRRKTSRHIQKISVYGNFCSIETPTE